MLQSAIFISGQKEGVRKFKDKGYRGLLLSTCQSVAMFSSCNNVESFDSGRRLKLNYETFYRWPLIRNQWSTFDAFPKVIDCSQAEEKWQYFTHQVRQFDIDKRIRRDQSFLQKCPKEAVMCTLRNICQDIRCQCCEEIRCLAAFPTWWLSQSHERNGSLEIKNCTVATTEQEHKRRCTGSCDQQDLQV